MRNTLKITTLILFVFSLTFAQFTITNTSDYKTAQQMLLANEINESGEPFAEALGYNLDDLDPFVPNVPDAIAYTLGIENYEYSRYQLGTIISRSGMGLHLMWAPMIGKMAAMEPDDFDGRYTMAPNGFKEDDELMKNIMHFSMLTNQAPPGNPWPQFADFMTGDPHLPQAIDAENFAWADFSTLRWERSKMDKILNPAAMGQSLMKQYLWSQDMLSAFHNAADEGIEADGTISPDLPNSPHFDPNNDVFYGGDGLDGFVGQVLTAEAINKILFLTNALAYDGSSLGKIDLMNYDPQNGIRYFPHKIQVVEGKVHPMLPPKATSLTVVDASSNLFDQASLLWGTLSFTNMMDPDNYSSSAHLAYKEVFDGDPFPAAMSQTGMPGPFDLMKGTSKVIFQNLLALHYNRRAHTFVDEAELVDGSVVQGNEVRTTNVAYVLVALKQFTEEFNGTPLQAAALKVLKRQADFLLSKLHNGRGGFNASYNINGRRNGNSENVEAQAAAIRGLYAAYAASGRARYLKAANRAYIYLIDNYYVSEEQAFRSTIRSNTATYTPKNFAIISGALREASLVGGFEEAPAIYTAFFRNIAEKMQLSEGAATGETGNDSDGDGIPFIPEQPENLPPVFASEAVYEFSSSPANANAGGNGRKGRVVRLRNFPNPFNPATTIAFSLREEQQVSLKVYNITGQVVAQLTSGTLTAGEHQFTFDGSKLSSGVYFYRLVAGSNTIVKKINLIK